MRTRILPSFGVEGKRFAFVFLPGGEHERVEHLLGGEPASGLCGEEAIFTGLGMLGGDGALISVAGEDESRDVLGVEVVRDELAGEPLE